ncbi:DUF6907 domain-containing protein [Streptomyces sp. NPDC008150]|uniref:DUF6907 domain-containing protein n=1 Tax=Streptomyces sp. NPDC008150 TaxID=3364816 RepID=UPI0036EA9A29
MSEESRARSFFERHYPEVAAFLAADRGGEGAAPVIGPTGQQNVHDDQAGPHVVVRVDYRLSRPELFAALAAGYATTNTGADPDTMTVDEIRRDVEAYLADTSALTLSDMVETVARQVQGGQHPEQMQALKRAMDRAYTTRAQPPVGVGCPSWCVDHYDAEGTVTHAGAVREMRAAAGGRETVLFPAWVSWTPAEEPLPVVVTGLENLLGLDPDGVRELASSLGSLSGDVYRLAVDLAHIRRGYA